MKKILATSKLYVLNSKIPNSGRGVFANVGIRKGEVIENCPIIKIAAGDLATLGESILITYFYFFGKDKEKVLLALGFGSIYNHSYTPNATYKIKAKENIIEFKATINIKRDQEITVNYNQAIKNSPPLWFES